MVVGEETEGLFDRQVCKKRRVQIEEVGNSVP